MKVGDARPAGQQLAEFDRRVWPSPPAHRGSRDFIPVTLNRWTTSTRSPRPPAPDRRSPRPCFVPPTPKQSSPAETAPPWSFRNGRSPATAALIVTQLRQVDSLGYPHPRSNDPKDCPAETPTDSTGDTPTPRISPARAELFIVFRTAPSRF